MWAAYLQNVATEVIEPDGRVLNLYASGDEYANRLHDAEGYTIIQSETDGFYYYAILDNNEPTASVYRVDSINPEELNIRPNINVSEATYKARVQRMNAYRKRETRAPNTGVVNNLNVFIRFSDQDEFEQPRSWFDAKFNLIGEEDYSLRNYFRKVSYNQLDYVTHHYPVCDDDVSLSYQDSNPRAYYMPYNAVTNPQGYQNSNARTYREHTLLANALNYIASQVPVDLNIDADNDGMVDNVCFVIRGPHTAWADLLWAHRWALYSQNVYINGKQVWDFTFQPENHNEVNVLCHEMFHSVGAPDLYHYTFNGVTPVGCWDIMESGYGHMGAYMKYKYGGWIDEIPIISTAGYYSLSPLTSSVNNAVRININGTSNEYFILEYRKQDSDIFEQNLPNSGLLVYRINTNYQGNADGPPDEVYVYRPNGTNTTNGLVFEATYSADFYRTAINNWTNPRPVSTFGYQTGLNISDVGYVGETITFYYNPVAGDVPPQISSIYPAEASVLTQRIIELSADISHPTEGIESISYSIDSMNVGVVYSPDQTVLWDASDGHVGFHQLIVTATLNNGNSISAQSSFRIVDQSQENWFGWITDEPVYGSFGRGVIPIRVAIDLDLGETEYLVRKLAFHIADNPWGDPQIPGLVSAKINRFANGVVTEQTLLDIGDIFTPMEGRYEHVVNSDVLISGKIAVVLNIYEYQLMLFDQSGTCGHSWLTETGRPWTDALARGVIGAAIIELLLQAPPVGDQDLIEKPSRINLSSYPNPFNPQTTIRYTLPSNDDISVSVYNMKGQHVRSLVNGYHTHGEYEVTWNGLDADGKAVGSGLYFVRLSGKGSALATKKIILSK